MLVSRNILSKVFDVSTGGSYKKGGGYDFFTGRDGSAAFVTGKFDDAVSNSPSFDIVLHLTLLSFFLR
jgi:hypothetical protein